MTDTPKRRFEDHLPAKPLDWTDAQAEQSSTAGAARQGGNTNEKSAVVPPLTAPAPLTDELRKLVNAYRDAPLVFKTGERSHTDIAFDAIVQFVANARPTDDHLWDQTIRDRDTYHEWADKLADAIAKHFDAYIGEHSNMNCPWAEALEVIERYEDEKPLHFAALLPGPYYMDPPDGGSVSVLEQFRRMAEDAAQWRAHVAKANNPVACEHCGAHLPLHLLTCPVAVNGMAEGKKKEAPEPLRQLLIDLSNNTYFCGLHLSDETKYAGYLAAAEKAEQSLIELFEQATAEPEPQQVESVSIEPTYYVRHPDDSYSVADPQPGSKVAQVEKSHNLTIREAFEAVGGWMNGGEMGYPSFGSFEALSVYTTKMIRSYLANKEWRESAAPVQADQARAAEVRAQALKEAAELCEMRIRQGGGRKDFIDAANEEAKHCAAAIRSLAQSSTADKASEVRVAEWQPIETAPRDGTLLLLAAEFDRPGDWRIKVGGYWDEQWIVFGASWSPSRWMNLPAAPSTADSGNTNEKGGDHE